MDVRNARSALLLPLTLAVSLALATHANAQEKAAPAHAAIPAALIAKVNSSVDADTARLTAIFKDLHQHPEIAFTETRTAAIVAKDLKSLGYTVTEGIGTRGRH